ncbi:MULTISPECIES: cupin domain-containing protein [Paraburkholderia]|uniref:Cupin domain-containing protein n=1 Tax=Paraburkholderia metrosideri TaxID=580937 RepID=A0ABW9E247_9BURK
MQSNRHKDYYHLLELQSLMPGWKRKNPNVWPHPKSKFKPAIWRFNEAKNALAESVKFLSPEDTERRNLLLVNPFEGNSYPTTSNLIAAYQMVAPGESAPAHRHSPSALRVVLSASRGAVTFVNGQRIDMNEGDVIFTPNWAWHSHANEGIEPAYWVDFLDVPFVQHVEAVFFERCADTRKSMQVPPDLDPNLQYRTLGELDRKRTDVAIQYDPMPTIGVGAIRMEESTKRCLPRSTASSIYTVLDGNASIVFEDDGSEFTLGKGDVFALPCWTLGTIFTSAGASLLRVCDEPLLRMTGLLREEQRV